MVRYLPCSAYRHRLPSTLNHGRQTVSCMETVSARDGPSTQASSACTREAAVAEALQDVCRKADPVLIASLGNINLCLFS